jgi:hypothetical protein
MSEALALAPRPLSAIEIRAQVNLIQEVMQAVMKKDTHYGTIPGCKKPSLWKPGAEVLFATFRISVDPIVEDLSTSEEARFRVTARAHSQNLSLGSAVGEASSDEEKYKWRETVCQEEFDATPEDRKRLKWKRSQPGNFSIQQVRTEVADHRNTILKMAAKRAYVALALQVTAASDIFTQDIEDLPSELQNAAINGDAVDAPAPLPAEIKKREPVAPQQVPPPRQTVQAPQHQPAPRPQTARPPVQSPRAPQARTISEAQARRFYAIWKQAGRSQEQVHEYLQAACGVADDRQMPADKYEAACRWAQTGDDF